MKLQDIKDLRVSEIAADDSLLFMWVTKPNLKQGMEVLECWGFEFITIAFDWVKLNKRAPTYFMGMGHYTRANAEYVLLGKRGDGMTRVNKGVRSLVTHPIMEHSRKPDIYDRIEALVEPKNPVELFARRPWPGWLAYGFDISGKDIREEFAERLGEKC